MLTPTKNKIPALYLTILFLFSSSCNNKQEELTQQIQQKIETAISEISKNPNQPIEEIQKLSQLDYKTVIFPLEIESEKIDETLNKLGQERWDCSTGFTRPRSAPNSPELVIICKRTPETVLRFVPKSILGR